MGIVKIGIFVRELFTNVYETRPILLFQCFAIDYRDRVAPGIGVFRVSLIIGDYLMQSRDLLFEPYFLTLL